MVAVAVISNHIPSHRVHRHFSPAKVVCKCKLPTRTKSTIGAADSVNKRTFPSAKYSPPASFKAFSKFGSHLQYADHVFDTTCISGGGGKRKSDSVWQTKDMSVGMEATR